ncbi:cysteine hydrolase family protein [Aquicoccus porphyridii]|uniref:cysteine hydrolase family protein n=1 Tax=Aquicoccus porphyridii TaxID=1852029 RepID=UPI00273D1D15|nr:cysteine hydrolase family protein [Aquicoccus porphyridii]
MIAQFGPDTALLLIDVQKGVHDLQHWGGRNGRMNNPECDERLRALLGGFRAAGRRVAFTRHDSVEPGSPLKFALPTGAQIDGLDPAPGEIVVEKSVNSGFIGTDLDAQLRSAGITRLVIAGYFTNFCVETTTRMAGNMGYDCYLVHDACATCNHADLDGTDHDPELVHAMSVGNLHGEFCTAITAADARALLGADAPHLARAQGNEPTSDIPARRIA